jgi:hypothetical protein
VPAPASLPPAAYLTNRTYRENAGALIRTRGGRAQQRPGGTVGRPVGAAVFDRPGPVGGGGEPRWRPSGEWAVRVSRWTPVPLHRSKRERTGRLGRGLAHTAASGLPPRNAMSRSPGLQASGRPAGAPTSDAHVTTTGVRCRVPRLDPDLRPFRRQGARLLPHWPTHNSPGQRLRQARPPGTSAPARRFPCHQHATSDGQLRYPADNHGRFHPTVALASCALAA